MRSCYIAMLPLCLFPAIVTAFAQGTLTRVGLDDAKRYAVEHNFEVKALRHELEAARARRSKLSANFLPEIGVAGGLESKGGATATSAPIAYAYGSYNLFNGFRDQVRADIGDLGVKRAETALKQAEFRVGLDVERNFHLYLFKKSLIEMRDQAIARNNEHLKMVARTRLTGLASQTDVMEFEVKDSLLKSELFSAKQELEEARSNLKRLLGEEIGATIEPVGKLQHQHALGAIMDYLSKLKDDTGPARVAAQDLAIARAELGLSRANWLPEVNLEARAGKLAADDRADGSDSDAFGVSATLLAKWPLFAGLGPSAEGRERLETASKAEFILKDQLLAAVTKMEVSFRKLKTIEARVDLEAENQQRSTKYYDSVLQEYRRGYRNSADLKNAADGLFDAKLRLEQFKFQFLEERVELEKALGQPIEIAIRDEEQPH